LQPFLQLVEQETLQEDLHVLLQPDLQIPLQEHEHALEQNIHDADIISLLNSLILLS